MTRRIGAWLAALAVSAALTVGADLRADPAADARDTSAWSTLEPIAAKSIGHTSVVLKVRLAAAADAAAPAGGEAPAAAWKPRTHRGPTRYRGEIAAFRLARGLGLVNVPPAFYRAFDKGRIATALGGTSDGAKLFADEAIADAGGAVPGALIPWIAKLEFLPLESAEWSARWRAWLAKDGAIAADDRKLAAQISTMIAFDAVTGNWDRWSGGNVGFDRASSTLLFIDNDGAFFDPAPPALRAQFERLAKVDRFSRRFVDALRALDEAALGAMLGDETPGVPLLTVGARRGVLERAKKVAAVVDAKRGALGEGVFAFE
jgi:hypothetical protein